jgi:N-acetylmuramoyl-L-alanine amidase
MRRMKAGVPMRQLPSRIFFIILALFMLGHFSMLSARQQLFEVYRPVVVLDPGHGGEESGARGPEGALEKTVTLTAAHLLAAALQPDYDVRLTRTRDERLDLDTRAALANHHRADLFVSLHTGGSFAHSTTGTAVYYYDDLSDTAERRAAALSSRSANDSGPALWRFAQDRYLMKSRHLAGLIHLRLNGFQPDAENRLVGAPLAVLQGADMPAVLIEIGYLTNPTEEKRLQEQGYLINLVRLIKEGIDAYFEEN